VYFVYNFNSNNINAEFLALADQEFWNKGAEE